MDWDTSIHLQPSGTAVFTLSQPLPKSWAVVALDTNTCHKINCVQYPSQVTSIHGLGSDCIIPTGDLLMHGNVIHHMTQHLRHPYVPFTNTHCSQQLISFLKRHYLLLETSSHKVILPVLLNSIHKTGNTLTGHPLTPHVHTIICNRTSYEETSLHETAIVWL